MEKETRGFGYKFTNYGILDSESNAESYHWRRTSLESLYQILFKHEKYEKANFL